MIMKKDSFAEQRSKTKRHGMLAPSLGEHDTPNITVQEWIRKKSTRLMNDSRFTVFTTVVTLFALFGDDFRLFATHKRTDIFFNILTLICVTVFSVELVAAVNGKPDYFLGLFFWLDLVSTVTLMLDLTWVGDALFCSSSGGAAEGAASTSRAGRAGARASRTVRIIRLIRLVKLYKSYMMAVDRKRRALEELAAKAKRGNPLLAANVRKSEVRKTIPGEDMLGPQLSGDGMPVADSEDDSKEEATESETRVGKKLSDMTTRRVIVLVLVMLFAMPQFSTNGIIIDGEDFRSSAYFGAEMVYERWRGWCLASDGDPWCLYLGADFAGPTSENSSDGRSWYEHYLLSFLYGHSEGDFFWKLYWVGMNSNVVQSRLGTASGAAYIGRLAQLGQERFLGSRRVPWEKWDASFTNSNWPAQVTPLPDAAKKRLTEPWTENCNNFYGQVLTPVRAAEGIDGCSTDAELRCAETEWLDPMMRTPGEWASTSLSFAFDKRKATTAEAGLSMLQTVFICLAVGLGSILFSSDANRLLLNPIQQMMAKMETIKDDPLESIRLSNDEHSRKEAEIDQAKAELAKKWLLVRVLASIYPKEKQPMETVILESTIIKLGGLLSLSFGEGNSYVVGNAMNGTEMIPSMPGHRADVIVGICCIRQFADLIDTLKGDVMIFTNLVAEIVHCCADDYSVASLRNLGTAFLLVWCLDDDDMTHRRERLADMAATSLARMAAAIHVSKPLADYSKHPALVARFREYRVGISSALHAGWAIEGAIGSEYKIDVAYMSSIASVAYRLQAATEQYAIHNLLSHTVTGLMSRKMANLCRLIDHVVVKSAKTPLRVYTLDLDCSKIDMNSKKSLLKSRHKVRQFREERKKAKWDDDVAIWTEFSQCGDLERMRSTFSREFFQRFATAYRNYEAGQWDAARDMLYTCTFAPQPRCRLPIPAPTDVTDGPSLLLLDFMGVHDFVPPSGWPGYRELTER
eukprot:TRINITY_DN35945_c0_g1_i1.p1 TRINITY_DN35945_c0_g1~~TRINITY_DN35945_c0_g1_i1.p1  ORF type:complete len:972 (+),score=167.68 TRINITY_DN35945_c0_g1_i1:250-3165(+)